MPIPTTPYKPFPSDVALGAHGLYSILLSLHICIYSYRMDSFSGTPFSNLDFTKKKKSL